MTHRVSRNAIAGWLAFWAGFTAAELVLCRTRRPTLCAVTRHLFRTHTRTGRAVFTATYTVGAGVLYRHIIGGLGRGPKSQNA